jgi:hypothetical protein
MRSFSCQSPQMGLGNVIILNLVVKRPSGDAMIAAGASFS